MERVFTKQAGRFNAGDRRDYSATVWNDIERSAGEKLGAFSQELDGAIKEHTSSPTHTLESIERGRGRPKKTLGRR